MLAFSFLFRFFFRMIGVEDNIKTVLNAFIIVCHVMSSFSLSSLLKPFLLGGRRLMCEKQKIIPNEANRPSSASLRLPSFLL